MYQTAAEDAKRKALFSATNDLITAHNSNPQKTYTMEHNKFSAMVYYHFKCKINQLNLFYNADMTCIYRLKKKRKVTRAVSFQVISVDQICRWSSAMWIAKPCPNRYKSQYDLFDSWSNNCLCYLFFLHQVDLRNDPCMQPIRDQAGCGCCWAFGASATLEFTTCVRTCTPVALRFHST